MADKKININNVSWKTWVGIVLIILLSTFVFSWCLQLSLSWQFEARLGYVERQLEVQLNSSFYPMQNPPSYIVSQVNTTFCLQNGTTGRLDLYSADSSIIIQSGIDKLTTVGGSVYVKSGQYSANVTVRDKTLLVLDVGVSGVTYAVEAGGYCIRYANGYAWFENPVNMTGHQIVCGAFHSGTVAPSIATVGAWWYDTNTYTLRVYNGTAWTAISERVVVPMEQANQGPYTYMIFKNLTATYMLNGTTGAIDYGSKNESAVLNNAIGNLSQGQKMFIKSGTYKCHNVVLKAGIVIEGESRNSTVLQLDANDYLIKSHIDPLANPPLKDVLLKSFCLDGNKKAYPGGKSLLYGSFWYCDFIDLLLMNGKESNINLTKRAFDYSFENQFFNIESIGSDMDGLYASEVTDSRIWQSRFASCGGDAIHIKGCSVWLIADCYIGGGITNGIFLETASRMEIMNNEIDWCYQDHILMSAAYSCSIVNNRFYREADPPPTGDYSGIKLLNSYYNIINGNVFSRAESDEYKYFVEEEETGPPYTYSNVITGNVFNGEFARIAPVSAVDSLTIVRGNAGFVTENSGTAEASNDDWIAHGLAGEPDIVTLTIRETDANYFLQVKATNSTHFQIYLCDSGGNPVTTDKTIYWYCE
jgi:hypothetical protein